MSQRTVRGKFLILNLTYGSVSDEMPHIQVWIIRKLREKIWEKYQKTLIGGAVAIRG